MVASADLFLRSAVRGLLSGLGVRPKLSALADAMDRAFQLADDSWAGRRRSVGYVASAPKSACRAGCGWCCSQQVGVAPPEAIRLADHIAALPDAQRIRHVQRLEELDARTRGLSTGQRVRLAADCAFLGTDGACTVYAVRPMRCRGLHSIDAAFCAACHDDPDGMADKMARGQLQPVFLETPERLYDMALGGVSDGWAAIKGKPAALELTAAVLALLKDRRLALRWLGGAAPDRALHVVPDSTAVRPPPRT